MCVKDEQRTYKCTGHLHILTNIKPYHCITMPRFSK